MAEPKDRKPPLTPKQIAAERLKAERLWRNKKRQQDKARALRPQRRAAQQDETTE